MLLLFSYFSTRARLAVRKILRFGYTIDRPFESVKSYRSYNPLLYHDYYPVPGIRGCGIELLLSSNIALKFKDIEAKETRLPDLSGQKWKEHKMPSILVGEEGFIALNLPNMYLQLRESYFITHFC